MTTELTKFLTVYNQLGQTPIEIDMTNNKNYALVIRTLGNYLYTTNIADWISSTISLGDNLEINMNVFNNTTYQAPVQAFLQQLNTAFNGNLDNEIHDYLATTSDFTDVEKVVCYEFYGYMSRLQVAMKQGIFKDAIQHSVTSKETISSYAVPMQEFNDYTKIVSADPIKYNIIGRFNKALPDIASKKVQPDIFFDA